MEKKWHPCWCAAAVGVLIVVFTWWDVSWGKYALTALGAIVAIMGIVNKCCCSEKKDEAGKPCC
jgi:hypothetical protein